MTDKEKAVHLRVALERLLAAAPAFTSKPIGAPGSEAREKQDEHIAAEKHALMVLEWI